MTCAAIGSLWIGPRLSAIESACLRSMLTQGHEVTLFSDGRVANTLDGVRRADYREITGDRPVIRYQGSNHPALFSNIFRYNMLEQTELTWADLDLFLLRPLKPSNGYLMGWQNKQRINSAALRLPHGSPTLRKLIRFCDQPCPIPPWYERRTRATMWRQRLLGCGMQLEKLPWGTSGPKALTYYLSLSGEAIHAAPTDVYYPIPWPDWRLLLQPAELGRARLMEKTRAVHLWNKFLERFSIIPGHIRMR